MNLISCRLNPRPTTQITEYGKETEYTLKQQVQAFDRLRSIQHFRYLNSACEAEWHQARQWLQRPL